MMEGRVPRMTEGAAAEDKGLVGAAHVIRLAAFQQPNTLRVSADLARVAAATRRPIDAMRVGRHRRRWRLFLAGRAA
jgi:hypothetical protein